MNKYTEKYRKIVDELVGKSFPELKGKKIWIREYDGISYGGTTYTPFFMILWVNKKARKFTKKQQVGLVAHELCHFSIFSGRGFFEGLVKGLLYFLPKGRRKQEEMDTIKFSIEKGYGKDWCELSKVAWKDEARKKMNKSYWSPEEIKSYAKKVGKW